MRRVGLARTLSKLGYCSRSQAAALIRSGRVRLNGAVRRDPEWPTHQEKDRIEVDDARVGGPARIYLMLNKPRGMVTTASDEQGRRTIYDLLDSKLPWVAPVGRLDKASEGLLLLTNDSEWGQRVLDPCRHIEKTYHVQVDVVANETLIARLVSGISVGDDLRTQGVRRLREGSKNSWLEIVLDEGKNRQIRRMLEACGVQVLRLVRVAIGPVKLGALAKGANRPLSDEEKSGLDALMRQTKATRRGSPEHGLSNR
jgi:23S rRNA pseudouridine2605 synthase